MNGNEGRYRVLYFGRVRVVSCVQKNEAYPSQAVSIKSTRVTSIWRHSVCKDLDQMNGVYSIQICYTEYIPPTGR